MGAMKSMLRGGSKLKRKGKERARLKGFGETKGKGKGNTPSLRESNQNTFSSKEW